MNGICKMTRFSFKSVNCYSLASFWLLLTIVETAIDRHGMSESPLSYAELTGVRRGYLFTA